MCNNSEIQKLLFLSIETTFLRCTQKCYLFSQYDSSLKMNLILMNNYE